MVLTGLCLACYGILLLPLDVANRNSEAAEGITDIVGKAGIEYMWEVVLLAIVIMVLFVIPFSIFYYEESGEGIATQLKRGLCYGGITLIVGCIVITIAWAFLQTAEIPVKAYYARIGNIGDVDPGGVDDILEITVTLPIFAVAIVSLCGWVFFSMFAGVGLVALPVDLLQTWNDRPTSIDVKNWASKRNELKDRASKLRTIGEKMEKENFQGVKLSGSDKKLFNKFKTAVYLLEKDYEVLRVRKYEQGGNILYYLFMGVLGVIGVGVSILWIVHTVVFTFLHNAWPFLNNMLVGLDNFLPLLGIVGYGTFSFYLLWYVSS